MKTMNHAELVTMLAGTKGATFVGLLTSTDARLLKTGNPLSLPVTKHTLLVATIGADYQAAVNREAGRQDSQATFESGQLPKGRNWLVAGKVLVSDDGIKHYLRTEYTPGQRKQKQAKVLCYTDANGQQVSRETVSKFAPGVSESKKQQQQTGIEQTVQVRDYLFTSINRIRIAGHTYKLTS